MSKNSMFSIIIPAYNEAAVISRTLQTVLADDKLTHAQIIVVCNACHDDTVKVVNGFKRQYQAELASKTIELIVVETDIASKTNAINLGLEQAVYNNRILLDADILIEGKDLQTLLTTMQKKQALVASPKVVFNYSQSNFWVRHYYNVASLSTYNRYLRISNVIALSAHALDRIGTMPNVIADDDYIRQLFTSSEKLVVEQCQFEFVCPKDLSSLLKALTRIKIGNIQLKQMHNNKQQPPATPLLSHNGQAPSLLSLSIFTGIKLVALCRARWQMLTGRVPVWERDESSRR